MTPLLRKPTTHCKSHPCFLWTATGMHLTLVLQAQQHYTTIWHQKCGEKNNIGQISKGSTSLKDVGCSAWESVFILLSQEKSHGIFESTKGDRGSMDWICRNTVHQLKLWGQRSLPQRKVLHLFQRGNMEEQSSSFSLCHFPSNFPSVLLASLHLTSWYHKSHLT